MMTIGANLACRILQDALGTAGECISSYRARARQGQQPQLLDIRIDSNFQLSKCFYTGTFNKNFFWLAGRFGAETGVHGGQGLCIYR